MRIGLIASVGRTLDAFFADIVERWREGGHQVFPVAGTSSGLGSDVISSITQSPRLANTIAPFPLRRWARRHRLDVVLTSTATASALARLARLSCPVVYFCHGLHWDEPRSWRARPFGLIESGLLSRTDGVVTINSDDEAWFRAHDPHKPLIRLRAGVGLDLGTFRRSALPSGPPRLAWVGDFTPRKRPHDALEVVQGLRGGGLEVHLHMLGTGPLHADVARSIAFHGLQNHVTLEGHQPAAGQLTLSTAVLHTARWEGLPRVLLEAVAVGRPVFAYDVKGVRDIPDARLVRQGDGQALAEAISSFVAAPDGGGWAPVDPAGLSSTVAADELEAFLSAVAKRSFW